MPVRTTSMAWPGLARPGLGSVLAWPRLWPRPYLISADRELIVRGRTGTGRPRSLMTSIKYRGYPWLCFWTVSRTGPRRVRDESRELTYTNGRRPKARGIGRPSHGGRASRRAPGPGGDVRRVAGSGTEGCTRGVHPVPVHHWPRPRHSRGRGQVGTLDLDLPVPVSGTRKPSRHVLESQITSKLLLNRL